MTATPYVTDLGLTFHVSSYIQEQFRFPRTKRRRIREKWATRQGNWRPSGNSYRIGNDVYLHPATYRRLMETFSNFEDQTKQTNERQHAGLS